MHNMEKYMSNSALLESNNINIRNLLIVKSKIVKRRKQINCSFDTVVYLS